VTILAESPGRHFGRRLRRLLGIVSLAASLAAPLMLLTPQAASGAIQRHHGGCAWAIVPSPSPGTVQNILLGAGNEPGGGAWAVGYRVSPQSAQFEAPIAEHWNGSAWTAKTIRGDQSVLVGVYAPIQTSVWAVGLFNISPTEMFPVIDHFNGSRWAAVRNPRLPFSVLTGVAGASRTDIWAVGRQFFRNAALTIIEHYDGHSWTRVPSPSPKGDYLDLGGITVISPRDIWAVGDYKNPSGVFRTLIEHYDGHRWTMVRSPNVGTGDNYLTSVAALGPHRVWAVGRAFDGSRFRPLALSWNGSAWQARLLPVVQSGDYALNGLTAGPGHSLLAVGSRTDSSGVQRTMIEVFRHGQWRAEPSPNASAMDNVLYGVTVTQRDRIWAVGNWTSSTNRHTLTMLCKHR